MLEENILNISDPGQGPKSSATTQEKKKKKNPCTIADSSMSTSVYQAAGVGSPDKMLGHRRDIMENNAEVLEHN